MMPNNRVKSRQDWARVELRQRLLCKAANLHWMINVFVFVKLAVVKMPILCEIGPPLPAATYWHLLHSYLLLFTSSPDMGRKQWWCIPQLDRWIPECTAKYANSHGGSSAVLEVCSSLCCGVCHLSCPNSSSPSPSVFSVPWGGP